MINGNHNSIQDVDFKEIPHQQEQAPLGQDGQQQQTGYKVLHVQVEGNPSAEQLQTVAQAVTESLNKGTNQTVATPAIISSTVWLMEGQPPFTGVLIRGALSIEDVARVAYHAGMYQEVQAEVTDWFELEQSVKDLWIDKIQNFLRYGTTIDALTDSIARTMQPLLPVPSTNLKPIQIWNGSSNIENESAWVTTNFMELKNTHVFRYREDKKQYLCAASDVYVKYQGTHAFYNVDVVRVKASGVKPVNAQDLSKGFELQWGIDLPVAAPVAADTEQQAPAEQAPVQVEQPLDVNPVQVEDQAEDARPSSTEA